MNTSQTYALRQISETSIDTAEAIFHHYPAMKLGRIDAVAFYSGLLTDLALSICSTSTCSDSEWTVIAPPCHNLPAGANLMSRDVRHRLQGSGINCTIVEPQISHKRQVFNSSEEFERYHHYSKNDVKRRTEERQSTQQLLDRQLLSAGLEGKPVIVVNDISVTGTQQRFMQQSFDRCGVGACYWLYIFNIDSELAGRHPEIEHQINHSRINTLDEFMQVLINPQTRHTARCIARLFNLQQHDFAALTDRLTTQQCGRLYALAQTDGRYDGKLFASKLNLLKQRTMAENTIN